MSNELLKGQWSRERAWEWYNSRPWIRGFNGLPKNCVNFIAMWQEHGHDEVVRELEYEYGLARETGFNSVRIFIDFEVWLNQHDSFMQNLEQYISLADRYSLGVMLCLGNDCTVPKELFRPAVFGEQKVDWGYHGGVKESPHAGISGAGYYLTDEPFYEEKFIEMVSEIVKKYAHDPRLEIWNVWNEPGNSGRGDMSLPLLERTFATIRSFDPIQPLTADCWAYTDELDIAQNIQVRACEMSDVITFHFYQPYEDMTIVIEKLRKRFGRPLINNEWLHRINFNNVAQIFPLFYLERIGSYHWGLIAGFSQTYEPWGWFYRLHADDPHYDFTRWQHDLYRPNGLPYDTDEIKLIKKFCGLADRRDAAVKGQGK